MSYTWSIHIDWKNTGSFSTDVNEAIYCNALEIDRGFDSLFDVKGEGYHEAFAAPKVGTARLVFENSTGRFDPWNTAFDAIGSNIAPGKRVQILARPTTDGLADNTPLFTGFTKSIEPDIKGQTVSVSCVDGVEWLQEHDAYVPFYAPTIVGSSSTDIPLYNDIVDDIISSSQYPYGKTTWEAAGLPYYSHSGKAIDALVELATSYNIGTFFINDLGQVSKFYMGGSTTDAIFTYGTANFLKDIYVSMPYEHIKTTYRDYLVSTTVGTTDSVLWEAGYDKEYILAGATSEIFVPLTFDNQNVMGIPNTPVSGTDYVANTNQDGTGTNRTADVTYTITDLGTRAKKVVVNSSSDPIYMTTQKIRGTPYIEKEIYTEFTNGDYLGVGKKIVQAKRRVLWQTTNTQPLTTASTINANNFAWLGYPQSNKKIRLKLDTVVPYQLWLDIGDRFTTNIPTPDLSVQAWDGTTNYNKFVLTGISHSWQRENGQSVLTTWTAHHIYMNTAPTALTDYLVDDSGNFLIDESGNYLLGQIG